jgi:hypothetical protein
VRLSALRRAGRPPVGRLIAPLPEKAHNARMGVAFMVLLKRIIDLLHWLGNRRYLARLRANRRAVRAGL